MLPERSTAGAINAALKRALDIIVAGAALLVLSPLMLLIAAAIRIETPGPVLFAQPRLGRDGKPFRLFKFRKFPDGPAERGPAVTLHADARLTRVGRLLQESKLDELPQFWNVLTGDMTLVGPRPESPRFADCFGGSYRPVLRYRPGLFGPAQVLFRNESVLFPANRDPEDYYREVLFPAKARLDLAYYATADLAQDIEWLLRGVLTVFIPWLSGFRGDDVLGAAQEWIERRNAAGPARRDRESLAP
jgi:lipopolysaccharide/colanic/teichoic acid biosynthesis glycosyltransferase